MKKYTVGPGREILRDGKIVCYLGRLNPKEISPSELDEFTREVAYALNKLVLEHESDIQTTESGEGVKPCACVVCK